MNVLWFDIRSAMKEAKPGYPTCAEYILLIDHQAALKAKDAEIEQFKNKYHEAMDIISAWKSIDHADAVAQLLKTRKGYNSLLDTAVKFAEMVAKGDVSYIAGFTALTFLASPEVQAWMEKGKS